MRFYKSDYINELSLANKLGRALWGVVWVTLFRYSPRRAFGWRRFLLRVFKAKIDDTSVVYPSARVWAPWNLEMKAYAVIGEFVNCYNAGKVTIEEDGNLAGYNTLCTASHDIYSDSRKLITKPIVIGPGAWLFFNSFVSPGVVIGKGAIVAAGSVVVKDVQPYEIVGGNPSKFIRMREIKSHQKESGLKEDDHGN